MSWLPFYCHWSQSFSLEQVSPITLWVLAPGSGMAHDPWHLSAADTGHKGKTQPHPTHASPKWTIQCVLSIHLQWQGEPTSQNLNPKEDRICCHQLTDTYVRTAQKRTPLTEAFGLYQKNFFMELQTYVQQLRWLSLLFLVSTSPLGRSHGLTNIRRPDDYIALLGYHRGVWPAERTKTLPNTSGVNGCAKLIFVYILKYLGENPLTALAHEGHLVKFWLGCILYITGIGNPSQQWVVSFYLEPQYIIWLILRQAPKMGWEITLAVAISFLWLKMEAEGGSLKLRGDVCI